ncbi:MAG: ribulose-phosphate 3-epimerase [Eubacterium sp.]|jgi:ribulose-phosphate 3-epimerase|nr:ribulose-phosphate 3-epimerase [Eubacterium sp.]
MKCLSPSILSADFTRLGEQVAAVEQAGAQYLHFDVMDGCFVPNISFGMPVLESLRGRTGLMMDVHLMVEEPARYVEAFADCGADIITVHTEACTDLHRTVDLIKKRELLAGVALCPATPLSVLEYILPRIDMVLLMTVSPGMGGQKLIPYTLDKIRDLKKMIDRKGLKTDIEVDGGVNFKTLEQVLDAGANIIVAGSAVFEGDLEENTRRMLELMK